MKLAAALAALAALAIFYSGAGLCAGVERPRGWDVQYVDNSCIVFASADGGPSDPPWSIKMGFLHGNQLIFIFSAANDRLKGTNFGDDIKAWLVVNHHPFPALSIANQSGELVLQIENRLALQKALSTAKSLEIDIQFPGQPKRELMDWTLMNIPGAVRWLGQCSVIGTGALPR